MDDLKALKRAARAEGFARRAAAQAADLAAGGGAAEAAAALLDAALARAPLVAAGYLPIRDEFDPRPALALLAARGARLCAPVVLARATPLAFRRWRPGAPTMRGAFDVEIPVEDVAETPDLVIAPLLAFDRAGFRLGYGGGFYDRTLAALRAAGPVTAVGIAYAGQEVAAVPRDAMDAPLDLIVTEREVIRCG